MNQFYKQVVREREEILMIDREINLVKGIYAGNDINERLDIAEEYVELIYGDASAKGTVKVQFDFIPRPRLIFDIEFDESFIEMAHLFSSAIEGLIKFIERDLVLNIMIIKKFLSTNAPFRIIAIPIEQPITFVVNENLTEVIFHVINFYDFCGADRFCFESDEKLIAGNRLTLRHGKFEILIQSLPQTSDIIEKLDEQGGYGITHVGSIKRLDGKGFKADKTNEILENIYYFLSFARGFWTPPIFPIGFDLQNNKSWKNGGVCILVLGSM